MTQKTFIKVAGSIFLIIAVLHLLRILSGWDAMVGGWQVPMWLSWIAVIAAGYMAYCGLKKRG